jgi:hypothetical protein
VQLNKLLEWALLLFHSVRLQLLTSCSCDACLCCAFKQALTASVHRKCHSHLEPTGVEA